MLDTTMNPLLDIAKELEQKQRELQDTYRIKVHSTFPIRKLEDGLNAILNNTTCIDQYKQIYAAYTTMTEEVVKQVLLEKLQEVYKQIYEVQTKIARTLCYEEPEVISVDTIINDLKRLAFTGFPFWYESILNTSLQSIKEIHIINDKIFGTPISEAIVEECDDAFIQMTDEDIKNHNTGIVEKISSTTLQYDQEIELMKSKIPNLQLRKDPDV